MGHLLKLEGQNLVDQARLDPRRRVRGTSAAAAILAAGRTV